MSHAPRRTRLPLLVAVALLLAAVHAEDALPPVAHRKIRGVNLGGWLVLERWITPSLFTDEGNPDFKPRDQWTFCKWLGKDEARRRLERHWDTWVTEKTMQDIADAGLTHVRVPLGHWLLGDIAEDEPFVDGDYYYFHRAVGWARARGIQMWVDLHTAPGSQNGFDNSGHFGNATWSASAANVNHTVAILGKIAARFATDGLTDVVTGFGLLNEPDSPASYWTLLDFYNRGYSAVRQHLPHATIYIGDSFKPADLNWFWDNADAGNPVPTENVAMDSHVYSCFNDDLRPMTPRQHIEQVCIHEREHVNQCCWHDGAVTGMQRFVGEWTAAYDQTPSEELEAIPVRAMTPERRLFLRQYTEAQMVVWEQDPEDTTWYDETGTAHHGVEMRGWFYWNFKMESPVYVEWDYLEGVRQGWIPVFPRNSSLTAAQLLTPCDQLIKQASTSRKNVVDPFPPIAPPPGAEPHSRPVGRVLVMLVAVLVAGLILSRHFRCFCFCRSSAKRHQYNVITDALPPSTRSAAGQAASWSEMTSLREQEDDQAVYITA